MNNIIKENEDIWIKRWVRIAEIEEKNIKDINI